MTVSGLVLEIRRKYVIALDSNGCVIKIKIGSLTPLVGEIYHGSFMETKPAGYYLNKYKFPFIIISFLMIILTFIYSYIYHAPTTTVYIDASAQVTVSINRFNKVVKATALDSQGDMLLSSVNIEGTNLNDSLTLLYDQAINIGILNKNFVNTNQVYRINIDSNSDIDIKSFLSKIKDSPYIIHINNKGNVIYNSQYR